MGVLVSQLEDGCSLVTEGEGLTIREWIVWEDQSRTLVAEVRV